MKSQKLISVSAEVTYYIRIISQNILNLLSSSIYKFRVDNLLQSFLRTLLASTSSSSLGPEAYAPDAPQPIRLIVQ
jgi:hypothetical protein